MRYSFILHNSIDKGTMRNKYMLTVLLLISLISVVNASYSDMLKNLDVKLLCIVSWVTPPLVIILFIIGGYLLAKGTTPKSRDAGKSMITNAVVGLILVIMLILLSIKIGEMESLYWDMCWEGVVP